MGKNTGAANELRKRDPNRVEASRRDIDAGKQKVSLADAFKAFVDLQLFNAASDKTDTREWGLVRLPSSPNDTHANYRIGASKDFVGQTHPLEGHIREMIDKYGTFVSKDPESIPRQKNEMTIDLIARYVVTFIIRHPSLAHLKTSYDANPDNNVIRNAIKQLIRGQLTDTVRSNPTKTDLIVQRTMHKLADWKASIFSKAKSAIRFATKRTQSVKNSGAFTTAKRNAMPVAKPVANRTGQHLPGFKGRVEQLLGV
jgi:hypothetical protein